MWHDAIAQRPAIALERFYWDQKSARLWFAVLNVNGIAVELLMRMKTTSGWPGFIIAVDLAAHVDPHQGLRLAFETVTGRAETLNYKPPTAAGRGLTPTAARWLTLTTGTVGPKLLDEIEHIVHVVRTNAFRYVKHKDIHAEAADHVLHDTRRQWDDAWLRIAPRLVG